jgi:hypothetical protein
MITIDKDIPLPRHRVVYPFPEMEVGDSFFSKKSRKTLAGIAYYWSRKLGFKFATRDVVENDVEGVRVWRTK